MRIKSENAQGANAHDMFGTHVYEWKTFVQVYPQTGKTVHIKDELGTLDHWGSPDRTMQPKKKLGHRAVFCLTQGTVQSGIQETGQVGKGLVSLGVTVRSF